MEVLQSHLDPASADFRANAEAHGKLADELAAKLAAAREGGGASSRERHEKRGKLFVRDDTTLKCLDLDVE